MPTVKPTVDDLLSDIVRVNQEHGYITRDLYVAKGVGKYTKREILKHWGTFAQAVIAAGILESNKVKNLTPQKQQASVAEVSEVTGDKWSLSLPKTRIYTLQQLIEYCEVDESIWKVEKFTCTKSEMGYTFGKQKVKQASHHALYHVRATFIKKNNIIVAKNEIQDLVKFAKDELKHVPAKQTVYREQFMSGNMLEINVPDIHFGKLAWGAETGHGNYDSKIAEAIYDRAIDALLFRAKGYRFDEVLFVVGNDLLNSDDAEYQTTSGTVVTTDGRYQKSFRVARQAIIKAIEKCRQVAPVNVMVVPGNHDKLSSWHLGESLAIYFDRYDDVTVENEPTPRKYYQFGQVGLMLCHGNKGKRNDYPLQFATERPDIFGTTKFREVHTGHTHMTKLDEQHGVRVRVLPALCEPDDWHSENGYTGNLRNAEGYIWNYEEGLIAQVFYNDDSQPAIKTKTVVV